MSKTICFVFDQSGSMQRDFPTVIRCADTITQGKDCKLILIAFNDEANVYSNMTEMKAQGCTNILKPFTLIEQMQIKPDVIVFISDGDDTYEQTHGSIVNRLKTLKGIQNCVFLTVAVGDEFPTSVALQLRLLYNAEGLEHLPVTFALERSGNYETFLVQFLSLQEHIFMDHKACKIEFDSQSGIHHLEKCVTWITTRCLSRCARYTNIDLVLSEIQEARKLVDQIEKIPKATETAKPLASKLLKPSPIKTLLNAIRASRENFNLCESEARQGVLMANLTDVEKKDALAYGNSAGRFIGKSLKLNGLDFHALKSELVQVLTLYTPNPSEDSEIKDAIHLMSQDEIWTDAQGCIKEIERISNPVELIGSLGVIGRLFQCKTSDATQINPYLISITGHGDTVQFMNTVDFYKSYNGAFQENEAIFPVTNSASNMFDTKFIRYIATFMVTKNMGLEMTFALAALGSAVVCYALQHKSQFMIQVGNEALETIDLSYPAAKFYRFASYIEQCKTDEFYKCLVNTYPANACYDDCRPFECEHLTKFVMALAMAIKRGHRFTTQELKERMLALYREKVGREYKQDIMRYSFKPSISVIDALAEVPTTEALNELTRDKAVQIYMQNVRAKWSAKSCKLADVELMEDPKFYGLDKLAIETIFTRLNEIQSNTYEVFEITLEQRKWALNYEELSSFERNTTKHEIKEKHFGHQMQAMMSKEIQKEALVFITKLVNEKIRKEHMGLPTIPTMVPDGVEINPITGLAFNACCFPGCSHYMMPLVLSKDKNDKFRVSDQLWAHLEPISIVPGMHRVIKEEINTSVAQLTSKIIVGGHILPDQDKTNIKVQQVKKAVQYNGGVDWLHQKVLTVKQMYQ